MQALESFLAYKAYCLRSWSIILPTQAHSGHISSCLSSADLVAVLFFYTMRYDPNNFDNPDNDYFILSKGHASPLLYGAWKELGKLTSEQMKGYRQYPSVLEGHPTPRFPYVQVATGSLGMGLSMGIGITLQARLDIRNFYTYVLMGDAELAEGSVWEAVQLAAYYQLDHLVAIVDVNRLGQTGQTMYGHNVEALTQRFKAFGWHTIECNGHVISAIIAAYNEARIIIGKPTIIIAHTFKGHGLPLMENKDNFHGVALPPDQLNDALKQLALSFPEAALYDDTSYVYFPQLPIVGVDAPLPQLIPLDAQLLLSSIKNEKDMSTRQAFGYGLKVLGSTDRAILSLDADVANSTGASIFEMAYPERFFECFIAEQNMVGMAIGLAAKGKKPFISTFAAFLSRAHDQLRMAAISRVAIRVIGSHAGISIGQDGPSQMGLEDIAMMRCIPNSIVLYPSDAISTYKLLAHMQDYIKGVSYLRTTRMALPILYDQAEQFPIGGCKILRASEKDEACIIGAGITLHEALKAYTILQEIKVAVIDLYCIKPLDIQTIIKVARNSHNRIIIVEDHYKEGGIGEAVTAACMGTEITIISLAVEQIPQSGKPETLLRVACIDASAIAKAVIGCIASA